MSTPFNTPMPGVTPLTTPNGSSITSCTSTQLRHKVPIGYNGMPHIHPQNAPLLAAIANPNYLPHPWTQPTYHHKWHPDPISRFSTMHWTDTQIDRETDQQMVQATKPLPISLYSTNDSDAANNESICKAHTHTHTTVLRLCGICPGQPG